MALNNLFGIDVGKEIEKALANPQVSGVIGTLKSELACLKDSVAAIEQMLAYEYGWPVRGVEPHDPRRLPLIQRLENVKQQRLNLSAALGKKVTRSSVQNIGDTKALIRFIQTGNPEKQVELLLLPGTSFDASFFYDSIEAADAGEGLVSVQIIAQ